MKLLRNTVCAYFEILAPRWKDKYNPEYNCPTVLLADWKIGDIHNEIVITAARKSDGERFYPEPFYMSSDKIRTYKTQPHSVRNVYIVPINDLEVLERVDEL